MIKPHIDDPERCAALGLIPQTPDGPNWAEADPANALLAEKLIRYYWRFAMNVAGRSLKITNSVPRSVEYRVCEYQEEYVDDATGETEGPEDRTDPRGTGLYIADFESDIPRLIHKAAAAFDTSRGRRKFPPFLAAVVSNAARDWIKRLTIPGMNRRAADEPPEFNVAEALDSADLGALYAAADAEVTDRVQLLTR
jgi:hypothetical protein